MDCEQNQARLKKGLEMIDMVHGVSYRQKDQRASDTSARAW